MTKDEAKDLLLRARKVGIRQRLHKMNPTKYPPVINRFSAIELMAAHLILLAEKLPILFENDDYFYNKISSK